MERGSGRYSLPDAPAGALLPDAAPLGDGDWLAAGGAALGAGAGAEPVVWPGLLFGDILPGAVVPLADVCAGGLLAVSVGEVLFNP